METKKTMEIDINILIALCNILDKYEEFNNNILERYNCIYDLSSLVKLFKISQGEKVSRTPKLKEFYQKNKEVIDTINKFAPISNFILHNYSASNKKLYVSEKLRFFYQYLLKNRSQLDQILSVLEKIKDLGFYKINFVEGYDFTEESQSITGPYSPLKGPYSPYYPGDIVFFDNIQIEPNYSKDTIKYKTNGSNYKIVFHPLSGSQGKLIILNSLTFDPSRLPNKISTKSTVDYIVNLSKNLDESCFAIRTSVDLSINIDELQERYESLYKVMEELKNAPIKEKVRESLVKIQTELSKLQALSTEYNNSITEENPNITPEKIAEEIKLYLARRDSTDLD